MSVDWSRFERPRQRPLVMVITRFLYHFRRPVFEGLSKAEDFDVVFLHGRRVADWDNGVSAEPLANSHVVEVRSIGRPPLAIVWHTQTGKLIRRYDPDVIVCEAPHNFITVHRAARRQRRRGQGVVFWSKGPTPKSSESWKTRLRDRLFRRLYRRATVLVGYGRSSRQWFERLGFPPERIIIAQNTVDTRDLLANPEHWEQRGREFRQTHGLNGRALIGTVSRLIRSKRVDLLLEAAAKISTRRDDLTVLVGGAGPDADSLRQLATRWDALDVRFLGELPIDEDHTVFAASDVNVFPGAVGLAIGQSMALGKPTLCADEPGADSELIIHGKTGLRFARGGADELAACIEQVLNDRELAKRLGHDAREHLRLEATVDNMIARLIDAIRLALATRPRAQKENA